MTFLASDLLANLAFCATNRHARLSLENLPVRHIRNGPHVDSTFPMHIVLYVPLHFLLVADLYPFKSQNPHTY